MHANKKFFKKFLEGCKCMQIEKKIKKFFGGMQMHANEPQTIHVHLDGAGGSLHPRGVWVESNPTEGGRGRWATRLDSSLFLFHGLNLAEHTFWRAARRALPKPRNNSRTSWSEGWLGWVLTWKMLQSLRQGPAWILQAQPECRSWIKTFGWIETCQTTHTQNGSLGKRIKE